MAVREILQIGHPILSNPAEAVNVDAIRSSEVQGWIDDMIETLRDANGAGIAANQIGIPKRLFVIEVNNNPRYPAMPNIPLTVAINPTIQPLSEERFESYEGCLSVPNIRGKVFRHIQIAATYYNREGDKQSHPVRGYSACVWQHENDHLDGVLFPHRVSDPRSYCSWSMFMQYHQEQFNRQVGKLVVKWGA